MYVGFTLWRIILSSVTDANALFTFVYAPVIKNVYIHPFVLCISSSFKNIITLLLNLPLIIIVLILNKQIHIASIFYLISFLILFFISSICITYMFGVLCLRFRDLEHTINVFWNTLFLYSNNLGGKSTWK